jgi:regulator of protease activity HflC (stomatin/prohibitin superfamily)
VITKDNATVTVDGVAFFQVFDASEGKLRGSGSEQATIVLTMTNIRSVMARWTSTEKAVAPRRDQRAPAAWSKPRRHGVCKVNRIEIKDIVPPADLVEAMGRQMKPSALVPRSCRVAVPAVRNPAREGANRARSCRPRAAGCSRAEARERLAEAEARQLRW